MAIYEYRCESCGGKFEVWTQFKEETKCPSCGGADVGRLMSLSSFKLNGTGFYATDYKGKSPGASAPTPASEQREAACDPGSKPECAACPAANTSA
ncbi:MAG: zinc ribbon domain-containing protein [Pseudomonadota bacterium]